MSLAEGGEDRGLGISLSDLSGSDSELLSNNWDDVLMGVLGNIGELSLSGITSLCLLAGSWEDHELRLEFLNSINIGSSGVASSLIDGDADGSSKLHWNTGLLEFRRSESSTLSDLEVVSLSLGGDDGSQETSNGSWEDSGGLGLTSQATGLMARRLVEPCADISVMALFVMCIGEHVVLSNHFWTLNEP